MKLEPHTPKVWATLLFTFIFSVSFAQNEKSKILLNPDVIPMTFHGETVALRDFVADSNFPNDTTRTERLGYHKKKHWILNENINPNALPMGVDPALQTDYAREAGERELLFNFAGMGYTGVNPADPCVDVGPNHVIQMINGSSGSYFRIWNKTGTQLYAQTYLDSYMGFPGGAGDPIVLYDELADRWLMSEFISGGNQLSVAVSSSPDPLGTWYIYSFSTPNFPDYPKYSIWNNAYIVTTNENLSAVYALNRTAMLAGNTATSQRFTMPNFGTIAFQAGAPVSLNGSTLPPSGTPAMVMRMRDDAWTGATSDALEIWNFNINWTTPANTSLTQAQVLPVTAFSSELCGYTAFACVPQPNSSITLDPLREVLMNRVHYRNFGTHESIVCCHVVDVNGSDRHGIRWYELRRTNGTSGTWSIYQQGTYSPDAANRWMPSIGISASGNIALAYNVSSNSVYPSLRYTGRKSCDPLGVMSEPETVIIAGTAANGSNRYGDYNAMGLDPSDGETFWFTGKYNVNSGWSTRIAAIQIDPCNAAVQFGQANTSAAESAANLAGDCGNYTVVNIPLQIGSAPSASASITVQVSGGTATEGIDFDLITNTVTLSSSTLSQNITLWIYNDAIVEGNETITLSYTLNANGGNAQQGSVNQTATITINDDDVAPQNASGLTTLYSNNFESGFGGFTTTNPSGATAWQIGNAADATSGAFVVPTSNATQMAWINDDDCNCNQNNVSLLFPVLDFSSLTSAQLTFDSYYEGNTYQGNTESAILRVSINGGAFATIGPLVAGEPNWIQQSFDVSAYAGIASVRFSIVYSDGTGWLYGCAVDNILISGETSIDVQTAVNIANPSSSFIEQGTTAYFYDNASTDVMAALQAITSSTESCVTVSVDRAGTNPNALVFYSNATADFVANKTFRITASPALNGDYAVTLYYQENEIAAWESATGNSRNDLQIIRVTGVNAFADVTPLNYTNFSITSVDAELQDFNGDVALTANFSGAVGSFGIGIVPGDIQQPIAAFSVSDESICLGESVSFIDNSQGNPISWTWNFGDGTQSNEQNPSHIYATAGEYSVSLTVANNAGFNTVIESDLVVVNANPQPVFSLPFLFASQESENTVCLNFTPETLAASPSGGVFSGPGVTGNTFNVSNFDQGTTVDVAYDYTDPNGCSGSTTIAIYLELCGNVEEGTLADVSIYPNPNNGQFEIKGLEIGQPLLIYDNTGRMVYNKQVSQEKMSIDVQQLATGNYLLVTTISGKTGSKKLVIQRP